MNMADACWLGAVRVLPSAWDMMPGGKGKSNECLQQPSTAGGCLGRRGRQARCCSHDGECSAPPFSFFDAINF
jgi:hypothetical protein